MGSQTLSFKKSVFFEALQASHLLLQLLNAFKKIHDDGSSDHRKPEIAADALQLADAVHVPAAEQGGVFRICMIKPVQLEQIREAFRFKPGQPQEFFLSHERGKDRQRILMTTDIAHGLHPANLLAGFERRPGSELLPQAPFFGSQ